MLLASLYSIIVLTALMGAQIWRPRLLFRYAKWAYCISIFFIFFTACYLSYQQYRVWQASPLAALLIPPYQTLAYFAHYVFTHFFLGPLVALVASMLGWLSVRMLNRRVRGRFFESAESYLFAIGLFLSGHPLWIVYALSVFVLAIVVAAARFAFTRSKDVIFSFYYVWLPVALGTIIISTWFKFPFSS